MKKKRTEWTTALTAGALILFLIMMMSVTSWTKDSVIQMNCNLLVLTLIYLIITLTTIWLLPQKFHLDCPAAIISMTLFGTFVVSGNLFIWMFLFVFNTMILITTFCRQREPRNRYVSTILTILGYVIVLGWGGVIPKLPIGIVWIASLIFAIGWILHLCGNFVDE